MTSTIIRTTFAATLMTASLGLASGATAGVEHFDTDKASTMTKAVPAAQIVERHPGQLASGPTENPNQIGRSTPAFAATGMKGTFIASHPTGKGDVRR